MVTFAFNLLAWTVVFFCVGMYKPQWLLFFMKKPDRFVIVAITTVLVMIIMTLYGEGHRREDAEKATQKPAAPVAAPASAPVPVPEAPAAKK